jgi:hypothetical protein
MLAMIGTGKRPGARGAALKTYSLEKDLTCSSKEGGVGAPLNQIAGQIGEYSVFFNPMEANGTGIHITRLHRICMSKQMAPRIRSGTVRESNKDMTPTPENMSIGKRLTIGRCLV